MLWWNFGEGIGIRTVLNPDNCTIQNLQCICIKSCTSMAEESDLYIGRIRGLLADSSNFTTKRSWKSNKNFKEKYQLMWDMKNSWELAKLFVFFQFSSTINMVMCLLSYLRVLQILIQKIFAKRFGMLRYKTGTELL